MTRKRFIKLLMGTKATVPINRNTAEHMARLCQRYREPYADALQRHKINLAKRPSWWAYDFLCGLPGGGGS